MLNRSLQVLLVTLLLGLASDASAQVFNPSTTPAGTQPGVVQQAGGPTSVPAEAVEPTGWSGLPLPKISLPKVTMPKVTMPSMESVTTPMKSGYGKMKAGTKKAWEGTKEMFSFAKPQPASNTMASSQPKQSFWKRLLVRESEPQVPQTVGEFMSQPRLDP